MNPIVADLTYGLIGSFLFLFRNRHQKHKYPIAILVLGLFISQALYLSFDNSLPAQVTWAVSALGLVILYTLRFRDKQGKLLIDYIKLFGLVLLIIYPDPFYSLVPIGDSLFWTVVNTLTFYLLGAVYIYDRLILKPEPMKKKFIITLVIQTVLMGLFFIYAFVQKLESDVQKERAIEAQSEAVEAQKNTEQSRKLAEEQLARVTEELNRLKAEVKK